MCHPTGRDSWRTRGVEAPPSSILHPPSSIVNPPSSVVLLSSEGGKNIIASSCHHVSISSYRHVVMSPCRHVVMSSCRHHACLPVVRTPPAASSSHPTILPRSSHDPPAIVPQRIKGIKMNNTDEHGRWGGVIVGLLLADDSKRPALKDRATPSLTDQVKVSSRDVCPFRCPFRWPRRHSQRHVTQTRLSHSVGSLQLPFPTRRLERGRLATCRASRRTCAAGSTA